MKNQKIYKRILALILFLTVCISIVPYSVMADEGYVEETVMLPEEFEIVEETAEEIIVAETTAEESFFEEAVVEEAETAAEEPSVEENVSEEIITEEASEPALEEETVQEETVSEKTSSEVKVQQRTISAKLENAGDVIYENDHIILTGKMPVQGIVEAVPVSVEIEGQEVLAAYDINIYADQDCKAQGITWQPTDGAIQVTVKSDAFDVKKVNVYHMEDASSNAELVADSVSVRNQNVTFQADSFSIYSVTSPEVSPRIFYNFYNGSTVIASEYITKISEFYDPGVSPEYGQTFIGWSFSASETDERKMYSFEELKTQLKNTLAGSFADSTEINVYAKFKEAFYLRYLVMDEEGNVAILKSDSVRTDAADKSVSVNCDYSGDGEMFKGWIDAKTGTVYQNGSTITLDHHIDLNAKITGRCWLIFNANITGATFTGPQLIYDEHLTRKPEDPSKKGYVFIGWNEKADGSGTWWYKADGSVTSRFGKRITEDTVLYAQWEGAANSYNVIFWKQKATDEAGLANNEKKYDYVESITVNANVRTGDAVTLPYGYDKKADLNNKASEFYQTVYGWTDWNQSMTVGADGSTVVNVYYNLKDYHLYFQINDYVYTATTSNTGNQYGIINGEYTRIYYKSNAWRTSNSSYGTVYTGARFTRSSSTSWQNIKDIHAFYGHEIAEQFPVVGTNGKTYEAARWDPQTNSLGWNEVMSIVYAMPKDNVTFRLDTASRPTKTVNYYVEALPGTANTVSAPAKLYNINNAALSVKDKFVLYKSVDMKYNGVTIEDLLDITGYEFLGTDSTKNNNGFWVYNTSQAGTLNVYYKRLVHTIDFVSEGAHVISSDMQSVSVPFGARVIDYLPADPENGMEGYYFDGWYKDQDCSAGLEITESDIMPNGNAIFYAKWSTYRVRVVFEPGCTDFWFANNQNLSFRTEYGEGVSFANVKPGVAKRPGYKLTGWYLNRDYSGDPIAVDVDYLIQKNTPGVNMNYQATDDWAENIYGDNDGENTDVRGILKLYARWQLDIKEGAVYFLYEVEDGYCIFDAADNNQTVIPVDSVGHVFDTAFQIEDAPSGYAAGVDFTSWMVLNKNGGATSVVYPAGQTVTLTESEWADCIDTITVTDLDGNAGTMKVVRLRARFTSKEDKSTAIVFHGNGGTMDGGAKEYTQVVPVNATIDLAVQSTAFTREHYSLIGWNTKADGTGQSFPIDDKIYANNENLAEGEVNELYAIWQADIEITAAGSAEEVIFDGKRHSNKEAYAFTFTLGGEPVHGTEEAVMKNGVAYRKVTLTGYNITVWIKQEGWPVASGTEKGTYTAAMLSDADLEKMIDIDHSGYTDDYRIKCVYIPARLTIRDLMLTITQKVTGSFADTNKAFTVTLADVEDMTEGTYHGTIFHKIEGTTTEVTFTNGSTFWMRDGDVVKIEGLPKGQKIIFTEANDDYTTTWMQNGEQTAEGSRATVILTDDAELVICNEYNAIAPTGITTAEAPFKWILAFGVFLVAAVCVLKGRKDGRKGAK